MDWGLVVAVLTLALAALGGLVAWVVRFTKAESSSETAREALRKAESIEKELSEFRERVARDYATAAMVAAVEGRVVSAIDRLADRLDRILEARIPASRRKTPE